MNTIAAIPTMYGGVQFRSRLEARWAAFFDLIGWEWDYEPIDLNGYIPDFILRFDKPILVEVKPLLGLPSTWQGTDAGDDVLAKIASSGWTGRVLIVGATLQESPRVNGYVTSGNPINAGLYLDFESEQLNPFGFKACCFGPVDVIGDFTCLKCGHHDEGPLLITSDLVLSYWNDAGNDVQYKKPALADDAHPSAEESAAFRTAVDEWIPPSSPPRHALSSITINAELKSVQKKLAGRKDAASLANAEILKRVNTGFSLTTDPEEDLIAARDTLWSEAVRLDRENPADEYIRLDPCLCSLADEQQFLRCQDLRYRIVLDELLGDITGRILVKDTWRLCGFIGASPPTADQKDIGDCMRKAGWERVQDRDGRVKHYYYVRGTGDERVRVIDVLGSSMSDFRVCLK